MFRGVTEIKGLAIDVDSFGMDSFIEFKKIAAEYNCVFLTADKVNYEELLKVFDEANIIEMEPFQKYLAPNIVTHVKVMEVLDAKCTELVYVSKNHLFMKRAMGFLSGTIWVTNHVMYEDASILPDLLLQDFAHVKLALREKHEGFFGETNVDPMRGPKGYMIPVEYVCDDINIAVYTLGRYYGYEHYMHQIHPYSKALLLNKKEGKSYTGVFNKQFQFIISRAVKNLKSNLGIDGICAVPTKEGKLDRYKDIICQVSKENGIEDYGKNFECTRFYPDQKALSFEERRKNIKGAFQYTGDLTGKKVLLIDDIMTTGATISECTRELKQKGAKEIIVLVLAINQLGNYWSSDMPSVLCSKCGHKMSLRINSKGDFFYSCLRCFQDKHESCTCNYSLGWKQLCAVENQRIEDELTLVGYEDDEGDGWITLKREIKCPHCFEMMEVDIESDCTITSYERQMGLENLYEFDIENVECEFCHKFFRVFGHISEYPVGAFDSEEIYTSKI